MEIRVKQPVYGRKLGDFEVGQSFAHPRGLTITEALGLEFAQTFHEANPLFLNAEYARAHGYGGLVVSPLLTLNVTLGLGVQNDSEQAVAHLGYTDIQFPEPVFGGDTLRSFTEVLGVRERGDKPGIVHVRTLATNQRDQVVCSYERRIMIPAGKTGGLRAAPPVELPARRQSGSALPQVPDPTPALTGSDTYFEDFRAGDVIVHPIGRTVTDEHMAWTFRVGNTHPLHFDGLYSRGRGGELSGEPIVYGGLVLAWVAGLASRETTENAIAELGWAEGFHTAPTVSGDTLTALSRVVSTEEHSANAGVVKLQLVGCKNITAAAAWERYGEQLFVREPARRELGADKIPQKVLEAERTVLVKRRT